MSVRKTRSLHGVGLDLDHLSLNTFGTLGVGELLVAEPLLALGVLDNLPADGGLLNGAGAGSALGVLGDGVGADGSVNLLVEVLELGTTENSLPFGELLVEAGGGLGLELVVVSLDVVTEDVVAVLLGIEVRLGLLDLGGLATFVGHDLGLDDVETGEALVLVGDVETTVASTLHGTEDTVSGSGTDEANIEVSLEWAALLHVVSDRVVRAIDLLVASVHLSETLVSEESAGAQETSAVSGGVVGKTSLEAMGVELLGIGVSNNTVTDEGGVDHLGDDLAAGATDAETVLSGVVLVLFLED